MRRARLGLALVAPVALVALFAALALPAWSADSWGYQISHELMSPFCPGRTLASCPSDKADELRIWILMQEAAGASREDVEAELVARYGVEILPAPSADDVTGIAGYAVPILGIVAGPPLVFWLLRRMARPPRGEPGGASGTSDRAADSDRAARPVDDDLAAEVDRELRELDA